MDRSTTEPTNLTIGVEVATVDWLRGRIVHVYRIDGEATGYEVETPRGVRTYGPRDVKAVRS